MTKLSFCITSYYKDIHYLENLLSLLQNQTASPYEIIIYCSGISSISISNSITINRINVPIKTIIDNKPQLQTVARNTCADNSIGDVVSFFDVDDIPHPQKIEVIIKYIQNYDFLVHSYTRDMSSFYQLNIDNIKYDNQIFTDPNPNSTNLRVIPERPICHGHLTIKKELFNKLKYDENFYFIKPNGQKFCNGEDGKFCQNLVKNNFKGIFIDEPLIIYT